MLFYNGEISFDGRKLDVPEIEFFAEKTSRTAQEYLIVLYKANSIKTYVQGLIDHNKLHRSTAIDDEPCSCDDGWTGRNCNGNVIIKVIYGQFVKRTTRALRISVVK